MSYSYLTGVTAAKLQWHLSNMNMIQWIYQIFLLKENFAYGKNDKQIFTTASPPHGWESLKFCSLWVFFSFWNPLNVSHIWLMSPWLSYMGIFQIWLISNNDILIILKKKRKKMPNRRKLLSDPPAMGCKHIGIANHKDGWLLMKLT